MPLTLEQIVGYENWHASLGFLDFQGAMAHFNVINT